MGIRLNESSESQPARGMDGIAQGFDREKPRSPHPNPFAKEGLFAGAPCEGETRVEPPLCRSVSTYGVQRWC